MNRIEILVSTMNKKNKTDINNLVKKMNIKSPCLVVNQCPNEKNTSLLNYESKKLRVLSFAEKGLSKSRNKAIASCSSKIGVIADDDLVYDDNFENIILKSYDKYNDADIIAFYVESENDDRPTSQQKDGRKMFLGSMKISSFQITFKKQSIIDHNIKFDEMFGAGSGKYTAGEENIFLFDCLKKGLKIYYVSERIAIVNHQDSTWFNGFTNKYLETLGAAYYRMTPFFSNIFIFQFLIRKHKLYKKNCTLKDAYKFLLNGKKRMSFRPFFVGDFYTNTGPAIVNSNIKKCIRDRGIYSKAKNKILRVFELVVKMLICDCVFFCSFSKINIIGIKIAKVLKKKTFYLVHGRIKKENEINNVIDLSAEKDEKYILDNINYIICVSKQIYEEISNEGYHEKCDYIFNGIDYTKLAVKKHKKNMKLIMSTGGLLPIKNNLIVCEAINILNKEYNYDLKYLIVGNDCNNSDCLKKYKFVKFLNSVSHKKCLELMSESFLYIQNSIYETFGLAIVEALVNDCNLLISENVGSKDIITTLNEHDLIFDVNNVIEISNKILKIIENPNIDRLKRGLDINKTSIEYRGEELMRKIEEKIYE